MSTRPRNATPSSSIGSMHVDSLNCTAGAGVRRSVSDFCLASPGTPTIPPVTTPPTPPTSRCSNSVETPDPQAGQRLLLRQHAVDSAGGGLRLEAALRRQRRQVVRIALQQGLL